MADEQPYTQTDEQPYTEAQRSCYGPYPRGDGQVAYADPLRTHRHLTHHLGGDPRRVLAELDAAEEHLRFEATEAAVAATVEAFGLAAFDPETGEGMQEDEVLCILRDFLQWWVDQKKSGRTFATWRLPASTSCPDPSPTPCTAP